MSSRFSFFTVFVFHVLCLTTNILFAQISTDYSDSEHWVNIPDSNGNPVDVFYLYPTAWMPSSSEQIYSTIDDPTLIHGAADVYQKQATLFESLSNVYAPLYRQANGEVVLSSPLEEQLKILNGIPKEDVYAALDYYFENYNGGRPFILAGHSQGADILTLVLSEYMADHPEIHERMIAAYVIGYSVTTDYLAANPHLQFAEGADDIQTVISWNTETPGATGFNPVLLENAIVINPLNWRRDGTYAGLELNLGSYLPNADGDYELFGGAADAQVDADRGVIVTNADQNKYGMPNILGFSNTSFHGYDIPFYYLNIQENALRRSAIVLSMYQTELYTDSAYTVARTARSFADQFSTMEDFDSSAKHACESCRIRSCCVKQSGFTWFANPFGAWGTQDSQGGFSGYDFNAYGLTLGAARNLGRLRYGFAFGYNDQTQKMDDFDGRIDGDVFHIGAFARRKVACFTLEGALGYSHASNDAQRNVIFPNFARYENTSSFDQNLWSIRLSLHRTHRFRGKTRIKTGIGLDYVGVRTGAIRESCIGESPFQQIPGFETDTSMSLKSFTYRTLEMPISVTMDHSFYHGGFRVTPRIYAAWIPELLGERCATTANFNDSDVVGVFSADSISPWNSRGRVATGVKFDRNTVSLGINYAFDFASKYTEHNLSLALSRKF